MNRVILVGNGFDLAHGLKTIYAVFINGILSERRAWYGHGIGGLSDG